MIQNKLMIFRYSKTYQMTCWNLQKEFSFRPKSPMRIYVADRQTCKDAEMGTANLV